MLPKHAAGMATGYGEGPTLRLQMTGKAYFALATINDGTGQQLPPDIPTKGPPKERYYGVTLVACRASTCS